MLKYSDCTQLNLLNSSVTCDRSKAGPTEYRHTCDSEHSNRLFSDRQTMTNAMVWLHNLQVGGIQGTLAGSSIAMSIMLGNGS